MDMNDTVVPNTVLTDCLNGTIITFDGNEFILQNDSGNGRVESCALKKDFIPLGIKQYGGIIYIASVNPFTNECEIGSFPSPERNITSDELPNNLDVSILREDVYKKGKEEEGLQINYLKVDFGDLEKNILRPGDKFLIYIDGINGNSDYEEFNKYYKELNYYINKEGIGERRLYHLHLAKISENGMVTYIEEQTSAWNKNHQKFFYTKDEAFDNNPALNTVKNPALFSVYSDKLNGYLAIVLEIEDIDSFSVDLGNVTKSNTTTTEENTPITYEVDFTVNSSSKSYNNVCGVRVDGIKEIEGASLSSNDVNKTEKVDSVDSVYLEIKNQYINGISSTILNDIPKEDILIKGKVGNLKSDKSNKITITPYSRFQYFEDLKYTLDLSYSRVTSSRESDTWRYSTNSVKDYIGNEFKQVEISTDFLVRGTENGLDRCNVMYIEFYDIHAGTSFIYPLSKVISGTYNFTIDCFPKEFNAEPYYDQDGNKIENESEHFKNLVGDEVNRSNKIFIEKSKNLDKGYSGYFLLLDKTKQREYLDAILKIKNKDSASLGFETLKKLCVEESNGMPQCIFIEPQLGDNKSYFYNNCFTQEQYVNSSIYNKLRFNNFYICRLCGLDIYENKTDKEVDFEKIYEGDDPKYKKGQLSKNCFFKEYNVINTLVTNGWFNNEYFKPITDLNRNFSTLKITDYETKRISEKVVLTETPESINKQLTVQGPTTEEELVLDSDPKEAYLTKLNVEKTVSGTYSLDTINLFQFGEIKITNSSVTPQFTEISVEENNNIPSLPTNSEIVSQKTTDVSIDGNVDNRKITVVANLKREVRANVVKREISGDSIQYVKAANSLNIMGFDGNSISSGITFFDDLNNSDDWILINTASSESFFSDSRVRDSWWGSNSDAIIYDKSKVSSNSSLVLNRIQKMFNLNNLDFKIAVIGFAGGNKTPKSDEYSPTVLKEKETGSTRVSSTKLLRDGTTMDVPYTYLILYKNTTNPSYPIGVLPLIFRGGIKNINVSTSIGKFFDSLYKEEVKRDGKHYTKYVPNDVKYHSNFDSIIEGSVTLNTTYNSDIYINKETLSVKINKIIKEYKGKSLGTILNESMTIPKSSQEGVNKSFNIPLSYTFKSGIFSIDLLIYSKMYNTAASYSAYIDVVPHDYLSYKLNNKYIPMEKLTIKDKGFYFPASAMDINGGPHTNANTLELNVYANSEDISNLHCNADGASQFIQCNLYIGWDPLFKDPTFTGSLENVENFFSILACS